MDQSALVLIQLILIVVLAISQLGLLLLFNRIRKHGFLQDSSDDNIENQLVRAKDNAQNIIHRAIRQANRILVSSELRGINILARQNMVGKDVSEQFQKHIAEMEKSLKNEFDESAATAEKAYLEFLDTIKNAVEDRMRHNEELLLKRTESIITATEATVEKFVEHMKAQVSKEVEAQFAIARSEVEQYKIHRLRVIDERIVEMLEEIVYVALAKKLSLVDQSELAYKALEEAKRANAFVETSLGFGVSSDAEPAEPPEGPAVEEKD